ncbi:guanylate kinase-like isoform X2 [Dysidea avara]|uniref:guanylate kinase-like isoform X2 n=1 Tax=Dysidea avara TaxID=196820 RepID=UPI0033330B1E
MFLQGSLVQRTVRYSNWLHSKERTLHLKTTERRVAVFAGVSALVGLVVYQAARAMHQSQVNKSAKDRCRPLVMAGPSGSGKSTLLKKLFAEFPGELGFSVSHTTRKPRPGEVDGKEYHFTTKDDMQAKVDKGDFIEHAVFSGNMYGTSKQAVADVKEQGKVCVLDIDMQGVRSLKKTDLNPVYVLVKPPSLEVLEQRLKGRGTDSEESVQRRLTIAKEELEFASTPGIFDHVIVNNTIDDSYQKLKMIYLITY